MGNCVNCHHRVAGGGNQHAIGSCPVQVLVTTGANHRVRAARTRKMNSNAVGGEAPDRGTPVHLINTPKTKRKAAQK